MWVWLPLYLLLMQKRVYAQGWPMTVFKYLRSAGCTSCWSRSACCSWW
ncbi:MAG: hypothetical protein ACYC42_09380 [Lysobacter sp.]